MFNKLYTLGKFFGTSLLSGGTAAIRNAGRRIVYHGLGRTGAPSWLTSLHTLGLTPPSVISSRILLVDVRQQLGPRPLNQHDDVLNHTSRRLLARTAITVAHETNIAFYVRPLQSGAPPPPSGLCAFGPSLHFRFAAVALCSGLSGTSGGTERTNLSAGS